MKKCSKCNIEKPITEYYIDKRRGTPFAKCKPCCSKATYESALKKPELVKLRRDTWRKDNRERYLELNRNYSSIGYYKQKDGYHRVYLLEDYNYVGCTEQSLKQRFTAHTQVHGRDCTNYRELFKSKDRSEALQVEAQYHEQGYEGKHAFNTYK